MQRIVVGATTHIDRHNTRITKQALESMANQIDSNRKPIMTIEHDTTLPPIGKIIKAWIEPTEDGEYKLLVVQETFEKEEPITLPDGSQGLKRQSETDSNPFVNKAKGVPEKVTIDADLANFASPSDYEAFIEEVKNATNLPFENGEIGRKSFIPDPEVIITLSRDILIYFVAKKIIEKFSDSLIDKLSDKISDDIVEFYVLVKSVTMSYARRVIPKNRPVTYIFSIPMTPHVEKVARTNNADDVAVSIMLDNLEEPLKLVQECRDKLGAERVQFLLNAAGEWKLNYMLTDKGEVIGTKKSFSRKARQFDLALPMNGNGSTKTPIRLNQPLSKTSKKKHKNRNS